VVVVVVMVVVFVFIFFNKQRKGQKKMVSIFSTKSPHHQPRMITG
jgi:preprotein translocase subunit YajC